MTEPLLRDSRLASVLFALVALPLLVGALAGLNSWPAAALFKALFSGSGKELFLAFHGYAMVPVVLFWASRPPRGLAWAVFLAWLLVAPLLWWLLRGSVQFEWDGSKGVPVTMMLVTALALPSLLGLAWRCARPPAAADDRALVLGLRWLVVLSLLFMAVPHAALDLTASLHPVTLDLIALRFEHLAGLNISAGLISWVEDRPLLATMAKVAYGLTPLLFLSVALRQLRQRPAHVATALLAWVGLTVCAVLAYHLFPITGPKYVFGSDQYLSRLREAGEVSLGYPLVPPFPRNGMPSMHFGWCLAATILWWRTGTVWWSRLIMVGVTCLTAVATLYLGEHYLIDLVVAVPFVLGALALCSTGVTWRARRGVVGLGFGTWLLWVLALRLGIEQFIAQPWLCQVLLAWTFLAVALQCGWMARFAQILRVDPGAQPVPVATPEAGAAAYSSGLLLRAGAMFFVSGMAALVYQVLFAKELALIFGSTATATFTVLATFLGGMAIGSLIGGVLAGRLRRPLVVYAFVEVFIAVYCVATPQLFGLIQSAYVALAGGMAPDAPQLLALRVALGALVLLVPTVLMGTTLPLLAQATGSAAGRLGTRVAWLYFANTGGAALGALLAAYAVIPTVGAKGTTLVAALLNLLVALGALELAKRVLPASVATPELQLQAPLHPPWSGSARNIALLALGVGGVLSLGLEVVYVHLLSIVAGNSVYAFGLMVATFLVGLSLGGELARRVLLSAAMSPLTALILMLLGLSCSVALGGLMWNSIPDYFGSFADYAAARSFASREVVRGLVCSLLMVPPTLFIGAAYVMAMDIVTSAAPGRAGQTGTFWLGMGAAVNTAGNIAGVLLFGFVLLPWLGGMGASQAVALGGFALALLVLVLAMLAGHCPRWPTPLAASGVAAALLLSSQTRLDYDRLSSGANVYFVAQQWGQVIDHAESIDGGLTTVAKIDTPQGPNLTLLTNGKFQGSNAQGGEMQAQVGFALAPLLHQPARDRALVIGYGTGVTTRVFHEAGFEQVDVAEISRDIVRLADQHFGNVNLGASHAPGVRMHYTDGRNLLLLSRERYDVISLEITSIWFAGAASLYSQQFYQLARQRMKPDGVLQQWMQMHRLNPTDLLHIMATLRSEFRHVSLYLMGSQGILVATNAAERAEPDSRAMQALRDRAALAKTLTLVGRDPEQLATDSLLKPASVDRFLTEVGIEPRAWLSTDDNLRLEYDTPRANVNDAGQSFADNKRLLERFR